TGRRWQPGSESGIGAATVSVWASALQSGEIVSVIAAESEEADSTDGTRSNRKSFDFAPARRDFAQDDSSWLNELPECRARYAPAPAAAGGCACCLRDSFTCRLRCARSFRNDLASM